MNKIINLKELYVKGLMDNKSECLSKIQNLKSEQKEDEANFEKIKLNIYEIFETLFISFEKRIMNKKDSGSEELYQKFCMEYLETFHKIPISWQRKLDYAIKNDLSEEIAIEELKLEVAESLKIRFQKALESGVN